MEKVEEMAAKLGVELPGEKITDEVVAAMIVKEAYFNFPGTTATVCLLELYNGYQVRGFAAAASPENFNDEIGRQMARKDAVRSVWPIAGFWLRQKLWQAKELYDDVTVKFWIGLLPAASTPEINPAVAHVDAVRESNTGLPGAPADLFKQSDPKELRLALINTFNQLADGGILSKHEASRMITSLGVAADDEDARRAAAQVAAGGSHGVDTALNTLKASGKITEAQAASATPVAKASFDHGLVTIGEFAVFGYLADPAAFVGTINQGRANAGDIMAPVDAELVNKLLAAAEGPK
jgi:hypothetical protein